MAKDLSMELKNIVAQLNALDARVKVIAQRMKIIEKNEQIIGKTLITHSKKIKELEQGKPAAPISVSVPETEELEGKINEVKFEVEKLSQEVEELKTTLDKVREDLNEVRYVVDNINPVAYVTVDQVVDLIKEIVDEKLSTKKRS